MAQAEEEAFAAGQGVRVAEARGVVEIRDEGCLGGVRAAGQGRLPLAGEEGETLVVRAAVAQGASHPGQGCRVHGDGGERDETGDAAHEERGESQAA